MEHIVTHTKEWLTVVVVTLLLVLLLPLVALLAFALRAMLLVAVAAALVAGAAAYGASPAFRQWFRVQSRPEVAYRGLRLATDVSLSPAHSWVRAEGEAWVGVDDVLQAALGPVEDVEMPPPELRVRRGDRLFRLRRGNRVVDVPSPVAGAVVGCNPVLRGRPELINEDPFDRGWVVRLQAENLRDDRRSLLRGRRARSWHRCAADRLSAFLPARPGPDVPGEGPVEDIYRHIDDAAWRDLNETLFRLPQPADCERT